MSLYPLSVIDRNVEDVSLQQPRSITIRQVTDGTDTIVATIEEQYDGTIHVRVGEGSFVSFDLGDEVAP